MSGCVDVELVRCAHTRCIALYPRARAANLAERRGPALAFNRADLRGATRTPWSTARNCRLTSSSADIRPSRSRCAASIAANLLRGVSATPNSRSSGSQLMRARADLASLHSSSVIVALALVRSFAKLAAAACLSDARVRALCRSRSSLFTSAARTRCSSTQAFVAAARSFATISGL